MANFPRCAECNSPRWRDVGIVNAVKKLHLYQCGYCKRAILVKGELEQTEDPTLKV